MPWLIQPNRKVGEHKSKEQCDYSSEVQEGRVAKCKWLKRKKISGKRSEGENLAGWGAGKNKGERPERERGKDWQAQGWDNSFGAAERSLLWRIPGKPLFWLCYVLLDLLTVSFAVFPYESTREGSTAGTRLPRSRRASLPRTGARMSNLNPAAKGTARRTS